ncbi:11156_t:CDS:2 [Diversispora eburnea]|uniref:11156_t:CDS:1 n=1 Tax=Diversispora eburnea TaxID=1213867 RepID=A0A9N8YTJ0_9GLOM|nr:11156_t:CDS:2 [Diversispora eburnea]
MTGDISACKNFYNRSELIGSILKLPGAPKVFEKLESFTSLENLSIDVTGILHCDSLFWAISNQKETLKNYLSLASPFTQLDSFHYSHMVLLNYCTKITELTLHDLKGFDASELLCQMAENVPESLETIEIRMGISSADRPQLFALSDEHFKVIEEYGVQFDIRSRIF